MPTAEASDRSTVWVHADPPATLRAFFARRRRLLGGIVVAFTLLAAAAAIADAWLLLRWDRPIQRFVESNRGDDWDTLFRSASRLGSTLVVLTVGPLLAALSWRRCRAVSIAIIAATFARPLLEFVLKRLVDRDRPNLRQLVDGNGPSFPSGHPMAAMALWGLLPVVVGLFTTRRRVWWASVIVSATTIVMISASRVYLGVHWLTDVVAGLLIGSVFLLSVEWVMRCAHGVPGSCRVAASTAVRSTG